MHPFVSILRRGILFATLSAALLTGCSNSETTPPRSATHAAAPAELSGAYTRFVQNGPDDFAMELAVRTFAPVSGSGPEVILVSAVHIGSTAYYARLQEILDAQQVLLFEGVSEDPDAFKKLSETGGYREGLYDYIARASGLVVQAKSIQYNRDSFKHADLSLTEMRKILDEEIQQGEPKAGAAREALQQIGQLEELLAGGGGVTTFVLRGMLGVMHHSPQLRTLFLFHLSTVEDSRTTQSRWFTPGMKRLEHLILHDRNLHAMDQLQAEINQTTPPANIGVFYGAGHMPGMEKILVHDMNYRLTKTEWVPAFTLHPRAAGLTDAMIEGFRRQAKDKEEAKD